MNAKHEVNRMTHEINAYKIDTRNPFIYNSRIIFPDYVDMRLFASAEEPKGYRSKIIGMLKQKIEENGMQFDYICAVVTADVPFASMVAHDMKKNMFYIRAGEKGHGKGKAIEGVHEGAIKGKVCMHVSDLMTTGKAGMQAHTNVIREEGILPWQFPMFDRLQGGSQNLLSLKPPVQTSSLSQMDEEFYEFGIKNGFYTKANLEEVFKARSYKDSSQWGGEFLQNDPEFVKRELQKHVKGRTLQKADIIECFTEKYSDLLESFAPKLDRWLSELGVNHVVKVRHEDKEKKKVVEYEYKP